MSAEIDETGWPVVVVTADDKLDATASVEECMTWRAGHLEPEGAS